MPTRTVDEGFRVFVERLTPSGGESRAATMHRASIKACLEKSFGMEDFFRTGSFGNGTSIRGFSDVDYFAQIPRERLKADSTLTLSGIRYALDRRFPDTGVRVSCPAIRVPFGSNEEATEIVPADYLGSHNDFRIYEIPDSEGGWMYASPDAHNWYVRDVDRSLGGKVKPLVRLIKAWKYYWKIRASSFYLEIATTQYAQSLQDIDYPFDVAQVLSILLDTQLAPIQDPMGVSGEIRASANRLHLKDAIVRLSRTVSRTDDAVLAQICGKTSLAFDNWRILYNNHFPAYHYFARPRPLPRPRL